MPKLMVALPEILLRIKNSCLSFFKENFNTNSLIVAIFFSIPIYLNYFLLKNSIEINFFIKIIFTINLFIAFYYLFHTEHKWLGSGFFIGIFWFYWIGLSFRYYNLSFLIPLVDLFIALFYGFVFWSIGKIYKLIKNVYLSKIFLLIVFTFAFDYLSPFTFDWLKPEILFVNTIFAPFKIVMFLVLGAILFYKEIKYFSLIILIIALFFKVHLPKAPNLNISISSTNIHQDKKWNKDYIPYEIKNNFKIINKAIKNKKDAVVLPESAFPLFLNIYPNLMKKLKELSQKITIITGALHLKNNKYYNSTYIFENNNVNILDKHILVPFGEYIPLPFFQKEINELFFGGASDYLTSSHFGTFKIKNYSFINAICYEATVGNLYKLKPKYIIALSNDAWFMPSIMPSLQEMIIKTYAYKYKKIVYHSINRFKSYKINGKLFN